MSEEHALPISLHDTQKHRKRRLEEVSSEAERAKKQCRPTHNSLQPTVHFPLPERPDFLYSDDMSTLHQPRRESLATEGPLTPISPFPPAKRAHQGARRLDPVSSSPPDQRLVTPICPKSELLLNPSLSSTRLHADKQSWKTPSRSHSKPIPTGPRASNFSSTFAPGITVRHAVERRPHTPMSDGRDPEDEGDVLSYSMRTRFGGQSAPRQKDTRSHYLGGWDKPRTLLRSESPSARQSHAISRHQWTQLENDYYRVKAERKEEWVRRRKAEAKQKELEKDLEEQVTRCSRAEADLQNALDNPAKTLQDPLAPTAAETEAMTKTVAAVETGRRWMARAQHLEKLLQEAVSEKDLYRKRADLACDSIHAIRIDVFGEYPKESHLRQALLAAKIDFAKERLAATESAHVVRKLTEEVKEKGDTADRLKAEIRVKLEEGEQLRAKIEELNMESDAQLSEAAVQLETISKLLSTVEQYAAELDSQRQHSEDVVARLGEVSDDLQKARTSIEWHKSDSAALKGKLDKASNLALERLKEIDQWKLLVQTSACQPDNANRDIKLALYAANQKVHQLTAELQRQRETAAKESQRGNAEMKRVRGQLADRENTIVQLRASVKTLRTETRKAGGDSTRRCEGSKEVMDSASDRPHVESDDHGSGDPSN